MDKIIIEDLEVYAYHGVHPEEKKLGQLFLITLMLSLDLGKAAASDDLGDTANYSKVCGLVKTILQSEKYDLIETAANKVIEGVFHEYADIRSVKVLLKKPWAPMGHHLKYVAVEMERTREEFNGRQN
jgi:dihydroneopterin aldolase